MKNSRKNIHRGQLLRTQVELKGISITKLAAKAGFSRSSYYNHIDDPALPLDILVEYGKILGVNFIELVEGFIETQSSELQVNYWDTSEPETLEESKRQTIFWKNKYMELSEKYQVLLELQFKQK
ncbi:helix-turn-helix domain-containing protein [Sediminibacterium sp. TEGAF015]|uniref:helix-turn-helix domain-containing protein n=1 Tax=Sediminibacterium sp. TEGAF015 TaxID=575378 RepID=UPI00220073F1|nr:helix-turn-helix transcriptional regulator [Sediminibacterium sp. TEGAF015]BDQ12624.1 hypothetical protein TEGAF0_18410 [Sediminibacterium sp. TEGAF015]